MISLTIFLAHGQIVFFVWVTFGERKWSILAERRRLESPKWMSVAVGKAEVVFSLPRHGVSLIQFGW